MGEFHLLLFIPLQLLFEIKYKFPLTRVHQPACFVSTALFPAPSTSDNGAYSKQQYIEQLMLYFPALAVSLMIEKSPNKPPALMFFLHR